MQHTLRHLVLCILDKRELHGEMVAIDIDNRCTIFHAWLQEVGTRL